MTSTLRTIKGFIPFIKINQFLDVEPPLLYVIQLCTSTLKCSGSITSKLLFLIQCSLDHLHERLNMGNWKDVSLTDRRLITIFSYYKIVAYVEFNNEHAEDSLISKCFEFLDHGLLFGAPVFVKEENLLLKCADLLTAWNEKLKLNINKEFDTLISSKVCTTVKKNNENHSNDHHVDKLPSCGNTEKLSYNNIDENILKISQPSLETFKTNYFDRKHPVVVTNCMDHWPAMERWKDIAYLKKKAKHRTVPVELGSKYTDETWTQKLMTIGDFIETNILSEQPNIGYLAQHRLFDQIPELMSDLRVPDYCCLREDKTDDETEINAWFGPKGTISPLHFDPKHNLLAQVVGEKIVILFEPDDSKNLYCHTDNLLLNTAQVDPTQPDIEKFPNFLHAKPHFCVIRPGDMVYIPPKWWHYIKSLSISFSVSFWWM